MRKEMAALAAAAIGLAGCGDGGEAPRPVTKIEIGDNSYLAKLRGLDAQARTLTLRRAAQDADRTCRRSIGSAETGTYENMSVWTLFCEGDRTWAVFITPASDVQVRDCAQTVGLGLPACSAAPDTD